MMVWFQPQTANLAEKPSRDQEKALKICQICDWLVKKHHQTPSYTIIPFRADFRLSPRPAPREG
jgi:hypothetical protein